MVYNEIQGFKDNLFTQLAEADERGWKRKIFWTFYSYLWKAAHCGKLAIHVNSFKICIFYHRSTTRDDNMHTCDSIRCAIVVLRMPELACVNLCDKKAHSSISQRRPPIISLRGSFTPTHTQPRLLPGSEMRAIFKSNTQQHKAVAAPRSWAEQP